MYQYIMAIYIKSFIRMTAAEHELVPLNQFKTVKIQS